MPKVKVSHTQIFPSRGEEARQPSRILRYSRMRLGRYYADFCRDSQLAPAVYHYVIQREGSNEIISWDQRLTLKDAMEAAQKELESLATSDGNSLGCFWTDHQKDNPDFKLFTVSTENDNVRLAVQWAVAAATGGTPPKEETFKGPVFENSVTGTPHPVQCRKDLPGQIYLSAELSPEEQTKAVSTK